MQTLNERFRIIFDRDHLPASKAISERASAKLSFSLGHTWHPKVCLRVAAMLPAERAAGHCSRPWLSIHQKTSFPQRSCTSSRGFHHHCTLRVYRCIRKLERARKKFPNKACTVPSRGNTTAPQRECLASWLWLVLAWEDENQYLMFILEPFGLTLRLSGIGSQAEHGSKPSGKQFCHQPRDGCALFFPLQLSAFVHSSVLGKSAEYAKGPMRKDKKFIVFADQDRNLDTVLISDEYVTQIRLLHKFSPCQACLEHFFATSLAARELVSRWLSKHALAQRRLRLGALHCIATREASA